MSDVGDPVASEDAPQPDAPSEPPSLVGAPPTQSTTGNGSSAEPDPVPEEAAPDPGPGPAPQEAASAPIVKGASPETPPAGEAGRVVGGVVQQVSADEVDLTLDDGRPAVIHRRNFDAAGTDPTTAVTLGDRLVGAVLSREDPKNRVVLSRAWAQKKQAWTALAEAAEAKQTVEGRVTSKAKRGVVVDVHGLRGFVPNSHLDLDAPTDMGRYVGETLEFRVLDIDPAKERLVLSRRALLMKQRRKEAHDLLAGLVVGEERSGTVSSLADYGAFVDLGGVTGLVHVSELAWGRVQRPGDVVTVGEEVTVKVLDVKVKRRRVSLSIRQLHPDPIDQLAEDEVRTGPVTRLVDFGAFVDVGGIEGLVHLSELAEHRVFTPEEIVTPGEHVRVMVLGIDRKRRRVELSLRRAASG